MLNLTILGAINSNSFRKPPKVKVLLDVLCVEVISVLHMDGKMILIDTPQSRKAYVNGAQQERKLTDLDASSATTNLDQK